MKSRSGSCETDAYVFLISLFSRSTACEPLDEIRAVGVVLAYVVVVDGLLDEVTRPDPRIDRGHSRVSPSKQCLAIELGDHAAVEFDLWVGSDHLQVEDRPAWPDCFDHAAQGVHDVLRLYASERPGEDDEVERTRCDLDLLGRRDLERDPACQLGGQRLASLLNILRVRVEREHVRRLLREAFRQAALAAAHLEHARPAKIGQAAKRSQVCAFRIKGCGHGVSRARCGSRGR